MTNDDYVQRVVIAVEEEVKGVDVIVDVVTIPGAQVGETLSHHFARLEALKDGSAGYKVGVWACWALSWMIQTNHCAETLDPNAVMPWWIYPRAAAWGVFFAVLIAFALRAVALAL